MIALTRLPMDLFDPRGRADRGDMLVAAGAVLAIEAALNLAGAGGESPMLAWCAKACSLWIGIAAIARRLHDLDLSAWWMAAAAGALCVWTAILAFGFLIVFGAEAFDAGSTGMAMLMGLVMLPAIGFTLWLHLAAGTAGGNRFGQPRGPVEPVFDPRHATKA